MAEAPGAAQDDLAPAARAGLGEDLRALALISLGIGEFGAGLLEEAAPHLEHGVMLAHRIGRPFLEFSGLAYQAILEMTPSYAAAVERGRQAGQLAPPHRPTDEPAPRAA